MVQLRRVSPGELGVGGRILKPACTWTLKREGRRRKPSSSAELRKKKRAFAIFINVFKVIYLHSCLLFPFPLGEAVDIMHSFEFFPGETCTH